MQYLAKIALGIHPYFKLYKRLFESNINNNVRNIFNVIEKKVWIIDHIYSCKNAQLATCIHIIISKRCYECVNCPIISRIYV